MKRKIIIGCSLLLSICPIWIVIVLIKTYFEINHTPHYNWDLRGSEQASIIPEWKPENDYFAISLDDPFLWNILVQQEFRKFLLDVKLPYGCEIRDMRLRSAMGYVDKYIDINAINDILFLDTFLDLDTAIAITKDWAEQTGLQELVQYKDRDEWQSKPIEPLAFFASTPSVKMQNALYTLWLQSNSLPDIDVFYRVSFRISYLDDLEGYTDYTEQAIKNCRHFVGD